MSAVMASTELPAGAPAAADPAPPRPWTVLCVDDEPNILSALRRLFRTAGHRILMAGDAAEALEILDAEPVDLVLSDMRMPGASGAELLEQVHLRWPHVLRLLLTGQSDMASTIAAINRGAIYRYITKPWNDDDLLLTVRQALDRRALELEKDRLEVLTRTQNEQLAQMNQSLEAQVTERTAELVRANEKLGRNYLTSIKVFANLVELRGEQFRGHAKRVADLSRRTAGLLGVTGQGLQQVFIAGLLHDIGQIGLSDAVLTTPVPRLTPEQKTAYERHTALAEQALTAVDDMQPVAQLIRSHHERHDGLGFPDRLKGDAIPLGARILAVADTWDDLQGAHLGRSGLAADDARMLLARGRGSQFDPAVLDAFFEAIQPQARAAVAPPRPVPVDQLRAGMVLATELRSPDGVLLLAADQVLADGVIERLQAMARRDRLSLILQIRG